MKSILRYLILLILLPVGLSFAQDTILIKVRIVNSADGNEIVNPALKINYVLSENNISPQKHKNQIYYSVVKGAEIKIEVNAPGYYNETGVFDTEYLYDDDVIEIAMNAISSSVLSIQILDEVTNAPVIANLQITHNGLNSMQTTHKDRPELEFSFDREGQYHFEVNAAGYEPKKMTISLSPEKARDHLEISLRKIILSQNITFRDKETNNIIRPPMVVEIINVSDKDKTTIWNASESKFEFTEGDTYNITVEKEGYHTLFTQIKPLNQPLEIELEPKLFAPINVLVSEEGTQEKIDVNINVTDPLGSIETIKSNTLFTPNIEGEHTFYFELKGFGRYELKKASEYKTDQANPVLSFLVLSEVEINLVIQDSITHEAINNPKVLIFKEDNNQVKSEIKQNVITFKKPPFDTFKFRIEAEGYQSKSGQVLSENVSRNTVTVLMSPVEKIEYQEYEFVFIDSRSGETIMKNQLLILDNDNNTVETLYNSSRGTYKTHRVRADKDYIINAKADGYNDLNLRLNKDKKLIELIMSPIGLKELIVSVYDDYTKEMLVLDDPKFELAESKILPYIEKNKEYHISLKENEPAKLSFEQPGYPAFANIITLDDVRNDRIEIFIKKSTYPLGIKVLNDLKTQQKQQAKAIINYLDGTILQNSFDQDKHTFNLESDPDEVLQIEINVPGFRTYKASNNRAKLAMYEIEAMLEPIPEQIPEPIQPVEEEVVREVVPELVSPDPGPVSEPKPSEPMVAEKGRRYRLDGINFEQSKTTMLYGSELKLNELLKFMNDNPNLIIEVIGHTDKVGDERQNQRLSEFRARTVANWLFNHGIDPERIITTGKGSAEPIAPNDTEVTKAQNRRIEIMVIES